MSLEYKILYLYFKKGFTMVEIAEFLEHRVQLIQKVIGAEVAQIAQLNTYKYVAVNKFKAKHNQKVA